MAKLFPIASNRTSLAVTETGGHLSDVTFSVSYAFGLAETPAGLGAVANIVEASGGVKLIDAEGRETFAACDVPFVTGHKG